MEVRITAREKNRKRFSRRVYGVAPVEWSEINALGDARSDNVEQSQGTCDRLRTYREERTKETKDRYGYEPWLHMFEFGSADRPGFTDGDRGKQQKPVAVTRKSTAH